MDARALLVAVLVVGCAPKEIRPGDACDGGRTDSTLECGRYGYELVCEGGVWTESACNGTYRGADGGTLTGVCDELKTNLCVQPTPAVGDACPSRLEGRESQRCLTATAMGVCVGGQWKACECDAGCLERMTPSRFGAECGRGACVMQ